MPAEAKEKKTPADYVDMFIGTSNSRWMLGPYAQEPFGMIQLGPDNQGNVWMGGYEYAIGSVSGFSHLLDYGRSDADAHYGRSCPHEQLC